MSKSVFYTGQTSASASALEGEDNLIETRLVPSSVSSIKPNKEKNIVCSLCDYTTHAKYYLNEHFRYVHLKVKVICDLCGKEFANINQHMRVSHNVLRSGILTKKPCQECHREYYDLTKHMAKAHQLKYEYDYDCDICHQKLKTKFILQRHMQRKHGTKASCHQCGKKVSNLDVHIKKMHSNVNKHSCKICQDSFASETELTEHLEICLSEKTNEADISGLNLAVSQAENGDIITLSSKQMRSYEVQLDGFERKQAEKGDGAVNEFILSQLKKLTPANPNELQLLESYVFDEQDQESNTAPVQARKSLPNTEGPQFEIAADSARESREDIDDGVAVRLAGGKEKKVRKRVSYQCGECDYSSNRSANYNTHYQMVHLKNRTVCQICGKPYSNINQHMRVVHKAPKSGKTEKSRCPHCPQEFYDLDQHLRRAHKDLVQPVIVRDCTCNLCGETFTKYANMKRHQLRIHEGYKVTCTMCNKKVSNIDKHMNVHKKKDSRAVNSQSSDSLSYVEEDGNILEITESHYIITQESSSELVEEGEPTKTGVIQLSQLVPLQPMVPVEIVQISKEQ